MPAHPYWFVRAKGTPTACIVERFVATTKESHRNLRVSRSQMLSAKHHGGLSPGVYITRQTSDRAGNLRSKLIRSAVWNYETCSSLAEWSARQTPWLRERDSSASRDWHNPHHACLNSGSARKSEFYRTCLRHSREQFSDRRSALRRI